MSKNKEIQPIKPPRKRRINVEYGEGSHVPKDMLEGTKIGGTIEPVYGTRCPMTYHLFETETNSISAFNGEALRYFSFGSFFISSVIAILIGYGFSSPPLSDFGTFMLYKATLVLGVLTLACFGFGWWAICTKNSMIDQIKRETISRQRV